MGLLQRFLQKTDDEFSFETSIFNAETMKFKPPTHKDGKPYKPSGRVRRNCEYCQDGIYCKSKTCAGCYVHPKNQGKETRFHIASI